MSLNKHYIIKILSKKEDKEVYIKGKNILYIYYGLSL